MALIIKLRTTGRRIKPYLANQPTHGRVQRAFAQQIGKTVGGCVASSVKKGMKISDIKEAVRQCAKKAKGRNLDLVLAEM